MRTAQQYLKLWALVYILLRPASTSAQLALNSQIRNAVANASLTNNKIKALTVGDQVPDIVFENVLNYKSKRIKLSDFKGKLVILDMWSTWCSNCIAAFPKMDRLQKQFDGNLQILLVNPYNRKLDPEERIIKGLERMKSRTGYFPSLPIPIHDTILNTYFPHKSVPHQVWIDRNGVVVAITDARNVTEENIQSIIKNKNPKMPIKNDWAYDRSKPLLVEGNGGNPDDFIYRSIFTGYKEGIGFSSGIRVNENNEITGVYMLNKSLRRLIYEGYSDIINQFPESRIIFESKNPDRFTKEFNPNHTYCYDLTFAPGVFTEENRVKLSRQYLKDELKRAFNVSVRIEKRKLRSLVITSSIDVVKSFTKFDNPAIDLDKLSIKKYIHNHSLSSILEILSEYFASPFIDETGLSTHVDIDFPDNFDLNDGNAIIQSLRNIGLCINEEERELEVVVITDRYCD